MARVLHTAGNIVWGRVPICVCTALREDHHDEETGDPGDAPTQTNLEWIEVTQEADFSDPLFDPPRWNTEVPRALHRFIPP